jgi:hypothetical protein
MNPELATRLVEEGMPPPELSEPEAVAWRERRRLRALRYEHEAAALTVHARRRRTSPTARPVRVRA